MTVQPEQEQRIVAAIEAAVQGVFALMQKCGGTPAMGEPG